MQAIEIIRPGGTDGLKLCERSQPNIQPNEVLIKVAAAGVNYLDILQRKGNYPPPPGATDIPGVEIAGTVSAIGEQVNTLKVGDKVCALVDGGGYAQYCNAHESLCLPIPDEFSFVEAAAIPETFFTVWTNLFDRVGLKSGETVLIHGGSSGIGSTAIQLATAFGADVITTVGSTKKQEFCTSLGASLAINYKSEDFVETVSNFTDGNGVDVVFDMVMGDYFGKNLKLLKKHGRLVFIATLGGHYVQANMLPIMIKRLTVTGSTLRSRTVEEKADIASALRNHVWPLFSAKRVKPIIYKCFSFTQVQNAHELIESSQHMGKIILSFAD